MAVSDDKERYMLTIEKSLKHKLQKIADLDNKKLGAYINAILERHVVAFERELYDTYGSDDFLVNYNAIFGLEHVPHLKYNKTELDVLVEKFLNNQ
ncbi:MAG: hypothetical protein K0R57_1665 [Paenibacillaceae bacterium]|jgi:hypothetical protein|nr:hypothetical protein [Paenibacillaceae bacterium]